MSIHTQSEPYTSRIDTDNEMYSTPNLFDHHNSYYRNTDNNHSERSLHDSQYSFTSPNPNLTSRETGTPIFGRYAQDGFWDDESDTTTIRQRGSSSTSHTIMTKSPASSGHRAHSTKGGDHYSRSVTPAGGGSSGHGPVPSPGLTPDQWGREEDKVDRGLFSWAKRPSVANLQAVMHGHPIDEHHNKSKDTPPPPSVPTKKKSFGMLKGMGRRGELTVSVDPADESFEAGPLPPTPFTCNSKRSVLQISPENTLRLPPSASSVFKVEQAVPEPETKAKQSGWKRSMSRLFKSKSSAALRDSAAINAPMPTSSGAGPSAPVATTAQQTVNNGGIPPVPTLPLNIKKRAGHAQSAYMARSDAHPTPPPSSTRTDFGPDISNQGRRPGTLRNESAPILSGSGSGSGSGSRATFNGRQQQHNSVYSILMSPPQSARSESFPLESHPSLPLDPFASSLNSCANTLPTSPVVVDHQPGNNDHFHHTLPARPKLPRHSPSLRDLKNFLPGNRQKLAKTKSLANLRIGKEPSPSPGLEPGAGGGAGHSSRTGTEVERRTKEENAYQSLSPLVTDFSGPPSIPGASTSAPVESPPLLPPKPPYFPPTTRPSSSSLSGQQQPVTSPGSPLTPPPTSPLPPTPPSGASQSPPSRSQTHTPVVGPSHTVPLAGEGESSPLTRSGSGVVLLPRSRSTSMSLRAPPSSSSFFDLYEQLGIWPTPEKKERQKGKENEEPTSPLESKKGLTASISDLASTLDRKNDIQPPASESGQISASVSATFSASSWQAAIDAFPMFDNHPPAQQHQHQQRTSSTEAHADMSMDFGLPYVNGSEAGSWTMEPEALQGRDPDALTPGDAIEGKRERAEASASRTQGGSYGHASGSNTENRSRNEGTGLGFDNLRPTGRRSGGSGSSSRNSSRERKPHGTQASCQTAGTTYSSDEGSDDDDDVPLSELHPQAQANRKLAEEKRARRKAERAAARAAAAAKTLMTLQRHATLPAPQGPPRNPGGHENWNGEGGVPAEVLSRKLSAILQIRSAPAHHQAYFPAAPVPGSSGYASSSRTKTRPEAIDPRALRPQRSFTGPDHHHHYPGSSPVQRSSTTRVSSKYERQPRSPSFAPPMPSASLQPSPVMYSGPSVHSPTAPSMSHGPSSSSRGSMSTRHPQTPQVPPPASGSSTYARHGDRERHESSHHHYDVSRHNTMVSASGGRHSADTRSRVSSNDIPPRPYGEYAPATTSRSSHEAPSKGRSKVLSILVEGSSRPLDVEVTSETYVRDLVAKANATLGRPSDDKAWVLCEAFGELGCERQVRDYEQIISVLNGWDSLATNNVLVFRCTNRYTQAIQRGILTTPPMTGIYLQYETKKGKWQKRWLETRGGQVFLAKNDKNKDEAQINTLFFDVYITARGYKGAPSSFVFIMKRNDPAKNFENPDDYMHVFSADEASGYRMASAIFDAKSYTLASTYPQMLASARERRQLDARTSHAPTRRPSGNDGRPLIELVPDKQKETGFTGKGLLAQ